MVTSRTVAILAAWLIGTHAALAAEPTTTTGPTTTSSKPDPIGHWLFDPDHTNEQRVKDLAGTHAVTIQGPVRFRTALPARPLLIDGDMTRISLGYDAKAMPRTAITVEAWLCIDKTVEWANVMSATAGDKGWALGCRQSSFSFGVSGAKTPGFTHLRVRDSLEWGRWYHVVGTYDGKTLKVYVNGRLENASAAQSGEIDMPDKADWVVGSFGKYSPRYWLHEVRLYGRALGAEEVARRHDAKRTSFSKPYQAAVGPILRRLDRETIDIRWRSDAPTPSVVVYGQTLPAMKRVVEEKPTTDHAVTIKGIVSDRMYYYRIASGTTGTARTSRLYEFDSTFDFTPAKIAARPSPYPQDGLSAVYARTAETILRDTKLDKGYCLVLGCGEGRLAYEIARRSGLTVIGVDDDAANVAAARRAMDKAGLYGPRATVYRAPLDKLPFGDYVANLIVSDRLMTTGELPVSPSEVLRVLRPCGGIVYLGRPTALMSKGQPLDRARLEAWLERGRFENRDIRTEDGLWAVMRRGTLTGAGSWAHQYGDAGNSGCSADERAGGKMQVLWFGRPGPRPMIDRGTRAPAPLSVNGRLFVQGDRFLFGLDAYNGTMLWVLNVPDLRRANIPRDGSNMTAAHDALYVAVRDRCWHLDPQTGEVVRTFDLPEKPKTGGPLDWGYIACVGDTLFGSAVRRGGLFLGADGEWYDRPDEESQKVVSKYLFAIDRKTGKVKWVYRGGVIINPTVAMGDGRLYFVESRSPAALGVKAGRMDRELTSDRYMVSLNAVTGKKHWEHYRYFKASKWVFYVICANDTLIALDTTDKYHIYGFDAKSGDPLWQKDYEFRRNHHGGAMQHPVVVGDVIYAEPQAFKLRTGEPVTVAKAANGCGTVSASAKALFYRDSYHTMYDIATRRQMQWTGIRPSCWLTLISAGGLVLAPEGSAGCHCSWPLQTTIAFVPKHETTKE